MQTPKARKGASEVPRRKSPATPRSAARQLKTPGSDPDAVVTPNAASKTSRERNPKLNESQSSRSPTVEKKRPNRVSELETQVTQLQEDLKKVKDQLNASESLKKRAQQEAEEAKKQFLFASSKLEQSEQRFHDITASEDERVEELRKISLDRDREWQSELEAVQKQHSMDSAALVSAMNEIHRLKVQLDASHSEFQNLRTELDETLAIVEKLRLELKDCKEDNLRLESTTATVEKMGSDNSKATEAYDSVLLELEQSKAQVKSLEELASQLNAGMVNGSDEKQVEECENEEMHQLKEELRTAKLEIDRLGTALNATETRYQEEYIQATLQIREAYDQVELTKSESSEKEANLVEELKKTETVLDELRANLLDKETEVQRVMDENNILNLKIENSQTSEKEIELLNGLKTLEAEVTNLREKLLNKETEQEAARVAAEQEALTKLVDLTEEAEKNEQRATRATEQLDAAQTANAEMEAELRRLKVQSDQWRKAAEAATAMLQTGCNGKYAEKTGSLDNTYNPLSGGNMGSPWSDDMDDDSLKKKNGNMLKKIGVLWKKGQK